MLRTAWFVAVAGSWLALHSHIRLQRRSGEWGHEMESVNKTALCQSMRQKLCPEDLPLPLIIAIVLALSSGLFGCARPGAGSAGEGPDSELVNSAEQEDLSFLPSDDHSGVLTFEESPEFFDEDEQSQSGAATPGGESSPTRDWQQTGGVPSGPQDPIQTQTPGSSAGGNSPANNSQTKAPGTSPSQKIPKLKLDPSLVFPFRVKLGAPKEGYLKLFSLSGRPAFGFPTLLAKKFGNRLNSPAQLGSSIEREKYQKIYSEIRRAVDRTRPTPRQLLMIDKNQAMSLSEQIEQKSLRPHLGAWSIAVKGTAVRHGFPQVPCAEFASEVLRQAYTRAGYDYAQDFNAERGNSLIWHKTAAVQGLAKALLKANFVPWSTATYRPPIGAILMNGTGETPGHAFMAAGDDGRLVVDNGAPEGRDLGLTSALLISRMFKAGVFFLPPGVQPKNW